ncbi:hypothetical protein GMORB2_7454 [Geosmithia morbida]|uniref:Uncharacterized protein n=1 Tax=Geosmithia morbida TaxID=1094350 RepID=A0A9P5D181_9HYPO|nr:uncharacterized protein GMORB2_7454 [Geosmithia morbida]KAF4122462.1 hypothetical protein GMORB2_7454 [Geosmithia morbida]
MSSATRQQQQRRRLILDFDSTITKKDTISVLASAAIAHQQKRQKQQRQRRRQQQQENDRDGILEDKWRQVVERYMRDLQSYKESSGVPEEDEEGVTTTTTTMALEREVEYLSGMSSVEAASLERVRDSGVFAGLGAEALRQMGRDAVSAGSVVLREGLDRLVDLATRSGWEVAVLSVNWSASFIRGVLGARDMAVVANEVCPRDGGIVFPDGDAGSRPLTTSWDKLDAMKRCLPARSVTYMGDSTTDLECLLYQRGVVMADSEEGSSLIGTLRRLGYTVLHVSQHGGGGDGGHVMYWASDFDQVVDSGLLPS